MQSDTINQTNQTNQTNQFNQFNQFNQINQINQINQEVQTGSRIGFRMKSRMAAESASYSRKSDVWRRQERDDGFVMENNGAYAKMMEVD